MVPLTLYVELCLVMHFSRLGIHSSHQVLNKVQGPRKVKKPEPNENEVFLFCFFVSF